MAKYTIQHSCGHEETRQLYGKHSERERKIVWLEDQICYECYKKQQEEERQIENKEAAKENKDAGLPDLQGSEKQIAWAETIRKSSIEKLSKFQCRCEDEIERYRNDKEFAAAVDDRFKKIDISKLPLGCTSEIDINMLMISAIQHILLNNLSSWWIEHRDDNMRQLVVKTARELSEKTDIDEEDGAALEAKAEATIMPPEAVSGTPAEITIRDDSVSILYPIKNLDFREIVKLELGFSWSGRQWELQVGITDGTAVDRAAEAGHRLVAAGFPVILWNAKAKEKAISGAYQPRHTRWITKPANAEEFRIMWSKGEDLYKEARLIAGSSWDRPYVVVPAPEHKEILDFAEQFDFRLSDGAQKLVADQEALLAGATVVDTVPVKDPKQANKSCQDLDPADVTGDIDDDLRDN